MCRCGCGFCYTFEKAYKSSGPNFSNAHCIPDCACALFVEDEEVWFVPLRVSKFNRAANNANRGLAVVIESDEEGIGNDKIIRHI